MKRVKHKEACETFPMFHALSAFHALHAFPGCPCRTFLLQYILKRYVMDRMTELIGILNEASLAYYQKGVEIMPNIEYDRLYDELLLLEKETGIILPDSPTQNVGVKVVSELPKERHASPMLSLDKTKSVGDLSSWLSGHEGVLSWKLDGLTVVLTYEGGRLLKAVTRGNGEIGEVITGNAMNFDNVPKKIPYEGRLTLRGEAIITYSDFEKINAEIPDEGAKYKNPRNLCSGSVRQLDPKVTGERHVKCIIFSLVSAEGRSEDSFEEADGQLSLFAAEPKETESEIPDTFTERFAWLSGQGFEVVEHVPVDEKNIFDAVRAFKEKIAGNDFPSDGLVLSFNDIAYGESLGRTAKFPRNAIAFKWQDETAETTLREVEWSASRTGLINPVAIFDPVELEGTTVTRASVHNVSIVEELALGIGDRITVYKANMIIPQIADNLTKSGNLPVPGTCPVCGAETEIRKDNDARYLYCLNPSCPAKKIKSFELMVSRDALNMEGLSEATLERFIEERFLREYRDLFRLSGFRSEIAALPGFGEKSADNLIAASEKARETDLYRFLYGLGIPGIGLAGAKLICRYFDNDYEAIKAADVETLSGIEKIGPVLSGNFVQFFRDEEKRAAADRLFAELTIRPAEDVTGQKFAGLTFVITGDVHVFQNRREVEALIESLGGKCAGSVSKKTSYLINNDALSGSTKNKKARELGIPILTEEEFIQMTEAE